jgi:hypothetical protein
VLQKPEGFKVKAPEGEVVVYYFKPSATRSLKFSGFPVGYSTMGRNQTEEASKSYNFALCGYF